MGIFYLLTMIIAYGLALSAPVIALGMIIIYISDVSKKTKDERIIDWVNNHNKPISKKEIRRMENEHYNY